MTFHQKIPFISFEKFTIFDRCIIYLFFLPPYVQRFFRPTVRTSAFVNETSYPSYDALRNGKEEKKDCVSFQKVYYSFDTWPLCSTSRNANGKISYIDQCRGKKKKKETKESRMVPSRIAHLHVSRFTGNQVPPPPRPKRRECLSSFRNSWANNSTENTHRDV